jgi:hypothetical protein
MSLPELLSRPRAIIANPLTTEADIEAVILDQLHIAAGLERGR